MVISQSQVELENCIGRFLLLLMEEDISLDIKDWMSEIKKDLKLCAKNYGPKQPH
jgi:hypothetical protein